MNTVDRIKKQRRRLTKPRKTIVSALSRLSKPSTVQEISSFLHKNRKKVDLASIYRTLHLLSEMGVVHVFEFGEGKKRFELMENKKHHHHFVCDSCGKMDVVSVSDELFFINEVKRQTQFDIRRHTLEFFGLCAQCK